MVTSPGVGGGGKNMEAISVLFLAASLGAVQNAEKEARGLRELTRKLEDRDPRTQIDAAQSLRALGPNALPALPHLLVALENGDEVVRTHLAEAIGELGTAAVPALIPVLGEVGEEGL